MKKIAKLFLLDEKKHVEPCCVILGEPCKYEKHVQEDKANKSRTKLDGVLVRSRT
jgi:hypothetical protein